MLKLVLSTLTLALAFADPGLRIQIHYGKSDDTILTRSQNLPSNWLRKVSVVEAIEGNWILYSEANFKGRSRVVLEGQTVDLRGNWNDVLASAQLTGKGCIKRAIDYLGNDIPGAMKKNVLSVRQCIQECNKNDKCKSVAYEASSLNCWLKHTENGRQVEHKASVVSANVACVAARKLAQSRVCVHNDYDFWGDDLGRVGGVATLKECVNKCRENPKCESIAYRASTKDCWPKHSLYGEKPKPKAGIESVSMRCFNQCG